MSYILNTSIIMGRLARDPEVRYTAGDNPLAVARYTVAVDRPGKVPAGAERATDFINCVAFGGAAETAEKYFKKGTKVFVQGRIQTSYYTNRDGVKIPTFEIVVDNQGMVEGKKDSAGSGGAVDNTNSVGDGFMSIPMNLHDDLAAMFK